jgi:hypothetical protein
MYSTLDTRKRRCHGQGTFLAQPRGARDRHRTKHVDAAVVVAKRYIAGRENGLREELIAPLAQDNLRQGPELLKGMVGMLQTRSEHGASQAAPGVAATLADCPERFCQDAQPVSRLGKAKRVGMLERLLMDVAKARLPPQVASESRRSSVMLATSAKSGKWGTVFTDDKFAAAIADCAVHHSRRVESEGPSHRLE